jgi:hypothetical protein
MAKKMKIKLKKTSPKLKKALNGVALGDEKALDIGEDSFNPESKQLLYNAFKDAGYFDDYAVSTRMTNNESGYDFTKPLFDKELGQFQQPVKEQNNTQFPKSKKFQPNIQGSRSSTETFMTGLRNLPDAIKDPSNPAAWAAVGDLPMTGTKAILEQVGARKTNNRLNKQSVEQFQDAQTLNFLNNYNDSQYGTTNIGMAKHGKLIKYPEGGRTPIKGTKEQYDRWKDSSDLNLYTNLQHQLEPSWSVIQGNALQNLGIGQDSDFAKNQHRLFSTADSLIRHNPRLEWGTYGDPFADLKGQNSLREQYSSRGGNSPDIRSKGNVIKPSNFWTGSAANHDYIQPVQPIIYQPEAINPIQGGHRFDDNKTAWNGTFQQIQNQTQRINPLDLLQRPKEQPINIQSAKPDLLQGSDINMFNPIPFEKGTYFTRERQSQEQSGGTDYFDKKTGKLMGTYEDGGIAKYKSMNQGGMANVEVENLETIQTPDGLIDTAYGNTHARGGIPMMLEEGSKVFSEKLKHPEKKKSFAKLAKKFETKKDFENLESPVADNINKFTADLNIQFKNKASDELFAEQENLKLNGVFGEKVKNNTMKDYEMKYGGLTKMDGKSGKNVVDNEPPRSGTKGIGAEFFGGNLDNVYEYAKKLGYSGKKNIGDLQEFAVRVDPIGVSNYMELVSPNNKALDMFNQKRKDAGLKPIDRNNLTDFSWSYFSPEERREAFKDKKWDFRFPVINKPQITPKTVTTPQAKQLRPSEKLEIPASTPIEKGKYNNQGFKAIPVVQPFQEPYLESPVARFTFNPNLIDYRNQNPDFTEIDRQYQGATTGDPRIDANLFAKTLNAKNQIAFGTQAQNRQGQMQVDQYNAGSLDRLQQLQYGEDNTYRGLVNQMRGALNTQKLMDRSVAQSNAQKQMDYYNFTLPTIDTLYGADPNEQYIKKGNPLKQYQKYGGKIKPKFKKKSSK